MPKGYWPGRNWSAEQIARLEELLERGLNDQAIGRTLGRSANAVNVMRKRRGLASRTEHLLSSHAVADRLGFGCSKSVVRLIRAGYLRGRRGQRRGANRQWYVTEDAVLAFLEDERFWHLWEPARITDPDLRDWAMELPRPRYLTLTQVAERYAVASGSVGNWLDKGVLPFVRRGNRLIPETALAGFVPPCERARTPLARRRIEQFERAGIVDFGVAP